MTDYGTDISTHYVNEDGRNDLDPYFRVISGRVVVAEAVSRRWTMDKGALFWDPNSGVDVRQWLNAKLDTDLLGDMQAELAAEAKKDERVASCLVIVTYNDKTLSIQGLITTVEDESFELVLTIDKVTAEILKLEVSE